MREIQEKHGVIFALVRKGYIRLEKRMDPNDQYFGFTIIPGEKVEPDESMFEAVCRGIRQERGVQVKDAQYLGSTISIERDQTKNIRHLWIVTDWKGRLSNQEKRAIRNKMVTVPLQRARTICTHPVTLQNLTKIAAWNVKLASQEDPSKLRVNALRS